MSPLTIKAQPSVHVLWFLLQLLLFLALPSFRFSFFLPENSLMMFFATSCFIFKQPCIFLCINTKILSLQSCLLFKKKKKEPKVSKCRARSPQSSCEDQLTLYLSPDNERGVVTGHLKRRGRPPSLALLLFLLQMLQAGNSEDGETRQANGLEIHK